MTTFLRVCERLFMIVGFLLLAVYGFFRLHSEFFQAYDSWAFDHSLHERHKISGPPPVRGDANNDAWPASDFEGWAASRILAYQKSLAHSNPNIVGRLLIPALGLNVMILEGTDRWTLNRSVGHIENTALPGKAGNVGLSGHRDGFFRNLGRVQEGDQISVVTAEATYTYRVEETTIVTPRDTWVLADSAAPSLTLVTCYPFHYTGKAPERFVVKAGLSR